MSKIRLHGSSSGYMEIAPPAAGSSATVTLPNSAGEILLSDGSAASLTQIPAANIVGLATAGFNRSGGFPQGITMADLWRLTTTYSIPTNSTTIFSTANWERPDTGNDGFGQLGTGMSVNASDHAAGVWTFPTTGFYLVSYGGIVYNGSNDPYEVFVRIEFTENGGSNWGLQTRAYGGGESGNYNALFGQAIVDVTSTSDVKMRLRVYSANSSSTLQGNTGENRNYVSFIRLGDT